jgi:hypothetical protein
LEVVAVRREIAALSRLARETMAALPQARDRHHDEG